MDVLMILERNFRLLHGLFYSFEKNLKFNYLNLIKSLNKINLLNY